MLCAPLCAFSTSKEGAVDAAKRNNKTEQDSWGWLLPAAVRDIQVPSLRRMPSDDDIDEPRRNRPTSLQKPSYSLESTSSDEDDEHSSSRFLTTIEEGEEDHLMMLDTDSVVTRSDDEVSMAYSIPKSYQLPPPEYFDLYSLPRAPSRDEDYDIDWHFFSKGMYNLPSPPSMALYQ